jgi:hypothetical protein
MALSPATGERVFSSLRSGPKRGVQLLPSHLQVISKSVSPVHLSQRGVADLLEARHMLVRHHHHVPAAIGIAVQALFYGMLARSSRLIRR